MLQKLKTKLLFIVGVAMLLSPALVPAIASAQNVTGNLCSGTQAGTVDTTGTANTTGLNCSDTGGATTGFSKIITTVINVLSFIVGGVSVVMIIVGGFRYIISGGNDSSVAGAKNTIIYALIGLVIVALAQVIVHFVLSKAISAGGP